MTRGIALRWSRRAERDLETIGSHIAADDPHAARAWVQRLIERAVLATSNPLAGRIVPEFGRVDVREVFLRTYRIVYRVQRRAIFVLFVLFVVEGSKRLPGRLR